MEVTMTYRYGFWAPQCAGVVVLGSCGGWMLLWLRTAACREGSGLGFWCVGAAMCVYCNGQGLLSLYFMMAGSGVALRCVALRC